jgi:hypothetical protein
MTGMFLNRLEHSWYKVSKRRELKLFRHRHVRGKPSDPVNATAQRQKGPTSENRPL